MAKDFSNNAAFEMLNTKASEPAAKTSGKAKKTPVKTTTTAKTFKPIKKENKSKKFLLLLKPTLHERLKTKAASFNMSINDLVNQILEHNV
jgi:hypothetical protein